MVVLQGRRERSLWKAESHGPMYSDATNVNEARKALKIQACPGFGHIRVAPLLLQTAKILGR